ncbi:MAG: hypothetical protein IMW96_02520 [Thermoanaerobacteraceae bacterium]|nr:hypothetical protein [Thermoanaerobacteraceae bacterium]
MKENRIRRAELHSIVMSGDAAAELFKDWTTVGTSGFTPFGYPEAVPLALAERERKKEKE